MLRKGIFTHTINQPKIQHYRGPIPALDCYNPDSKSTKKTQELEEWHSEKVAKEVVFDFQEEMPQYYHIDVTVLCLCTNKFQTMFQNSKTLDGPDICVDPFLYLAIAVLAFDGVYRCYFLSENTIMICYKETIICIPISEFPGSMR